MSEIIVGIDLGTTNSEIAFVHNGQAKVITEGGDPILPSMVGVTEDGRLLVGRAAKNQWVLAPQRTIKSIKRKMGESVQVPLGNTTYRPPEISALILRALVDRAQREAGITVRKAVITVPAYFNDSQRQATREAGELAGLEVVRILNEPTAAALTYQPAPEACERILVYDFGGGTFDVSIVQTERGVVEVLASKGDTQLGGDDFDEILLNFVAERFLGEHGIDLRSDRVSKARLLRAVEAAKRGLSDHPFARIDEEFIAEKDGVPLHLSMELARSDYEDLIRPLLDRSMDCVNSALMDAELTANDLSRVILVGGSTRTPLIGQLLEARLGQVAHREINPDLCVAMGAAIQGAMIAGQDVGQVLIDITPHSLGIKCYAPMDEHGRSTLHRFAPIIPRNTALPVSRSELFRTVADMQAEVDIEVFQGESNDVRENHRLGVFTVSGLARAPSGNPIVVQFDLTLDGILKVSARERQTGLSKQITIEQALKPISAEDRRSSVARLDEMFANRATNWTESATDNSDNDDDADWDESADDLDDDDLDDSDDDDLGDDTDDADDAEAAATPALPTLVVGPREGQREEVQARALLEKAERLRGKTLDEDRAEFDGLIRKVHVALTDRKWAELGTAMAELSDVLFYLEDA
ncbi:Hsp70 family protein [Tuwongella immobilis]|uniref:Heat-shock protein Hsp70 n=1 Tax=Tuwongella immobilis TaxID=692036 RepID=A0A6C2YNK9_9BACT|nr:Hsp70 family protein [Tuwongella immobilis]VIP02957.1 heat shock protein hsp70 : Heat shock protein Hsp70 OS=Candidatus Entotheonella sp. TSY1 GN=ETSY1_09730 PE=3 SV=1: HSP70 [Tuwongella immobilis]VTS02959.1 heat shock protein hsp70 : Heat shock protein Hsp70 OS=Candidatus Entotheonella sp. TSY1 GN=ETSY1_09730 PE=3 SV=1: HSP70 [Tuwongella immobilis]